MPTKYLSKDINPKKKRNFFIIFNMKNKIYDEIKYLSQYELAENFQQIIPSSKKQINHFSVTLAFLPKHLWKKLKKQIKNNVESYKIIKDGLTRYTIDESNQDIFMKNLFTELSCVYPNPTILKENVDQLDDSQHSSWLVISANYYLKTNEHLHLSSKVTTIEDCKINVQ